VVAVANLQYEVVVDAVVSVVVVTLLSWLGCLIVDVDKAGQGYCRQGGGLAILTWMWTSLMRRWLSSTSALEVALLLMRWDEALSTLMWVAITDMW